MKTTTSILTRVLLPAITALALLFVAAPLHAQTALVQTTLAAANTDPTVTVFTVASATGITAPISGQTQTYLLVDRELTAVRAVSGVAISVLRGAGQTRPVTHASGAVVTIASLLAVQTYLPSGSCTRTALPYVPVIVVGLSGGGGEIGVMYDCVGSQWMPTSAPIGPPVKGADVASATSITATGSYFRLTGTTAVATIAVPAGWAAGMCLAIEPTGIGSTTTAGNIGLATTTVVGKVLTECWNGTKWQPSY